MKLLPSSVLCLVILFVPFQTKNSFAETIDLNSRVEFEYHSDIQFDQKLRSHCFRSSCDPKLSGWRVIDIDGRLKRYTGANSLVFTDIGLDYKDQSISIARVLRPAFDDTSGLEIKDDTIEQAVFGIAHRLSEFTYGARDLKTKSFGPSVNNYLSFSLSGFDDDRIDWFIYKVEETLYASSSASVSRHGNHVYADRIDIDGLFGLGVGTSDSSKLSLNYDFLFETTVPGADNFVLSLAARSMGEPDSINTLHSYGIKINVFDSHGSEFTLGYSDNDFGRYIEFSLEHIWLYRNKIKLGGTDFNISSDGISLKNSVPISDSNFLFFSYTRAISKLFSAFVEYSTIDTADNSINNVLVGLKMSF